MRKKRPNRGLRAGLLVSVLLVAFTYAANAAFAADAPYNKLVNGKWTLVQPVPAPAPVPVPDPSTQGTTQASAPAPAPAAPHPTWNVSVGIYTAPLCPSQFDIAAFGTPVPYGCPLYYGYYYHYYGGRGYHPPRHR